MIHHSWYSLKKKKKTHETTLVSLSSYMNFRKTPVLVIKLENKIWLFATVTVNHIKISENPPTQKYTDFISLQDHCCA